MHYDKNIERESKRLDEGSMPVLNKSVCLSCAFLTNRLKATCDVFPKGIPAEYKTGKKQHVLPDGNDNGVTYIPRTAFV